MRFELFVALRYLLAPRRQARVSLVSLFSTIGVAVGVMALIIALALMTGLQGELRAKLLGAVAHIYLSKAAGFADYRADVAAVRRVPGVLGAGPAIVGKALASTNRADAFITVKGIDPALEVDVTDLQSAMRKGSIQDLAPRADVEGVEGRDGILLGQDLAGQLGVSVGDTVTLLSPQGTLSPLGVLPRSVLVRVAGIYNLGLLEFDSQYGLVSIEFGERLLSRAEPDLIQIRVADLYAAPAIAKEIERTLGAGYTARDWASLNQSLFSALWLEKMGISIAVALIVIVGALNIISSLILMVMQKSRDIAILKTMGASSRSVMAIFIAQGTAIGIVGTAIGSAGGLGLCWILDHYKVVHIPIDVYQVSYVPFIVLLPDFLFVVAGAVIICFLSTIYPSRQASRLDPVQALRFEVMPLVHVAGLHKYYTAGTARLHVLRELGLDVDAGEMVAVVGASGVGKSTLLHVLGGLDRADGGAVEVGGRALSEMSDAALVAFRNRSVGFVFQFHHLLPEFTALENVEMPMRIGGLPAGEARDRAMELLARVGLAERLEHRPSMLSGGEQQRVAVARALVMRPSLLLADEPTGDLDEPTAESLHGLLRQMHAEHGLTSVIATHNPKLAAACDRVLRLESGQLRPD